MKLALLTTETTHHAYFAHALGEVHQIAMIVSETAASTPPFPTAHAFESERDAYEREVFFDGADVGLKDAAEVLTAPRADDDTALEALRRLGPDVMVVFGTGKLGGDLIELCPRRILNLHGGDPEHYRGLDTHLWAIYHRQFDQLVTTLHHLNEGLDAGDVVMQAALPIEAGMPLHALRAANTKVCVELTMAALATFGRLGRFWHRPQRRTGQYCSFMPAVLKEVCVRHFEAYTGRSVR